MNAPEVNWTNILSTIRKEQIRFENRLTEVRADENRLVNMERDIQELTKGFETAIEADKAWKATMDRRVKAIIWTAGIIIGLLTGKFDTELAKLAFSLAHSAL